ncbi:MAG: LPP20 family lipoprotein [Pseudomonadota bacterium]|nr:LPP20 family lipoprotein [Pseudomonadota bacterium]
MLRNDRTSTPVSSQPRAFRAVAFGVALPLLWLLASCSSTGGKPQWIDQPESAYPAATHLTAVGSADDRNTAADRATANLAKIFEVAVQDSSMDFSSATVSAAQGQQVVSNQQEITRTVTTEARQVLSGAQVVESWQTEQGRVYALAILAKQPAATRFQHSIQSLDREVRDLINYASDQAQSPLAALNALKRARLAQIQRDQSNQNLMIVADGRGLQGQYDTAAVETLIRNALTSLRVQVSAEDDSLRAEIEQALATLGVPLAEQSNLQLQGSLDVAPVEQKQGWFWLRGSYELVFRDGNQVLGKQRWPVKVSSTEANLLPQRLRDEINSKLPGYVFELLSSDG